ncbi:hypothetical protein EJ07DRAFT_154919 [Lizonia empirigonia]|nr:hypothetical protein EJ07DRAFT_154919 [Lizonia empirigonia]
MENLPVSPEPARSQTSRNDESQRERRRGPPGSAQLRWVRPESASCNICWEPFDERTHRAVKIEVCGHIFAWACLETWFNTPIQNHNTCPSCRTRLFGFWDRDEDGNLLQSVSQQDAEVARDVD